MSPRLLLSKRKFRFGKPRPARVERPELAPHKPALEEEAMTPIQGIEPASKEEWRVAKALDFFKIPYRYQYPIAGGRGISGGQVLDFLVYTSPLPTPVFVQGTYWHTGKYGREDPFKVAQVKTIMGGQVSDPVLIWDQTLSNLNAAIEAIRRAFL